ncbi:MAG: pentapeptide repeat-containing protein, partial [Janthinobacterium lividum]
IAKNIDLTEAELDSLCKLDNAQLEQAVMTRIKAERVSFIRANMDGIKAEQADLRGAILEDASLKFANLEKAILSEAKARKIDMTGANLTNAVAISANFLQAVMRDMDAQNINLESANISDADLAGSDLRKAMMAKVDARRANLENVGLQDADLHGAKVHGAKVNEATNNVGTNQKDVTGEFTGPNGEAITPKAQQEQQEIINKLKNTSSLSKIIGNALDTFATAAGKISELIRQPFSTKMGKYVGLIGGITLGVAIAAAIPTGGLSLVAVAAIGAGVVAGCAVGGAVTGHFAAKRCGLSTAITGVASAVIMGPAIAGISTMASVVLNKALATVTGKTIDEHAAGVIEGAANLAAGAAAGLGVRKESQELMEKHQSAVAGHVKATQLVDQNPGNQKLLFEEMKKRAALEEANSLLSKNQNLHDGIAAVKKSIAGFVGQLPIIKHGAPAVEVKERAKIDKVDAIQR